MNLKKTFSLIIISTLFFSSVNFAAPAEWAKASYYSVKYEEVIDSGMTVDRLFQKNITREEFIEMLVKIYLDEKNINIESVESDDYFSDTSNTYIEYAYELGIVKGVGDNKFLPYKNVTRQEMAVMMKNILDKLYLTNNNYNKSIFSDRYDVSSWAVNAIDYCYYNNLINGMGNNMFKPKENATREQSFKLIDNIYNKFNLKDKFNSDLPNEDLDSFLVYNYKLTNLNTYIENNELVIVSKGFAPFGEDLNIKEDHYQIYRILDSVENISFIAVDKAIEVINGMYNIIEKKYEKVSYYIDKDTGRVMLYDNGNCIKLIGDVKLEIRVK